MSLCIRGESKVSERVLRREYFVVNNATKVEIVCDSGESLNESLLKVEEGGTIQRFKATFSIDKKLLVLYYDSSGEHYQLLFPADSFLIYSPSNVRRGDTAYSFLLQETDRCLTPSGQIVSKSTRQSEHSSFRNDGWKRDDYARNRTQPANKNSWNQ